MKIKNLYSTVFRLTDNEKFVLDTLTQTKENKSLSISEISHQTTIPRTSIYTTIGSLKSRSLIKTRKQGKEFLVRIREDMFQKVIENPQTNVSNTETHYGIEKMISLYENIISTNPRKRLYGIQSTETLRVLREKNSLEKFISVNQNIKKQGIVVEVIMGESLLQTYARLLRTNQKTKQKMSESFHGRASETTLVPEEYLTTPTDLIIINKTVYLTDWKNEAMIIIRDHEIAALFLELFTLIKSTGLKVDFHETLLKGWK